jgi:hypothetical protein
VRQLGLRPFAVTTSVAKIKATHARNYNILCYILVCLVSMPASSPNSCAVQT